MKIDRVRVQNFKSIDEIEVDFSDLNVLIGENAAGKSNFLELFQFLKDIGNQGLEDAIQLRGGVEYFRNTRIQDTKDFEVECHFSGAKDDERRGYPIRRRDSDLETLVAYPPHITDYVLEIEFSGSSYSISHERIKTTHILRERKAAVREAFYEYYPDNISSLVESDGYYIATREITRDKTGDLTTGFGIQGDYPEGALDMWEERKELSGRVRPSLEKKETLLSFKPHPRAGYFEGLRGLSDTKIYDIKPEKIKQGTTLKGKRDLEHDGNNLPLVLKEIVGDSEEKKKFLNIVGSVLPFIKDWETDTFRDKSVFLKILEEFEDKNEEYLPANLVSDGTINVIAIIIILYFESNRVVFIEEPERHMHPSLISNMVEMMQDVAENEGKQIFTTSHNVELIKNSDLDNILLVTRNENGFTQIERPANNEQIREFLNQGMGLGDLYVKNILEDEV